MIYEVNGKELNFTQPLLMAVINLTPDSFYDGGKFGGLNDVLADARQKVAMGAHILDLGAVSTRPGAQQVSQEEEWSRLEPVLQLLRKEFPQVAISIDTTCALVAEKAALEGADIINDISGGMADQAMLATVAKYNIPYVIGHIQGTPETMQQNPVYADVCKEVFGFIKQQADKLQAMGFSKIITDPCFGFGKTLAHNYALLKGLPNLCELGFPVLVGLSRKSMVYKVLNSSPVSSLNGTTALNTIALLNGASVLRVHDVEEAAQVVKLVEVYSKESVFVH